MFRGRQPPAPNPFPSLSWEKKDPKTLLNVLCDYVVDEANNAQSWYTSRLFKKRWGGFLCRFSAVVAGTIAGIIPILSVLWEPIDAELATVFAAFVGFCIATDKLGGFTSGWIRYILAERKIADLTDAFLFDWQKLKLSWKPDSISTEQITHAINFCEQFRTSVANIVSEETDAWASEFQRNLRDLEKSARDVTRTHLTGALNLAVTNGDDTQDGWTLQIDQAAEEKRQGTSAAVVNLKPGFHTVRITGTIDDKTVSTEESVMITGGQSTPLALTLK